MSADPEKEPSLTDLATPGLAAFSPGPPKRDLSKLLETMVDLIGRFFDEDGTPEDALRAIFPTLAAGMAADRAVCLSGDFTMTKDIETGKEPARFTILAHTGLRPEHLVMLKQGGKTVKGISRTMITDAMLDRGVHVMQHPLLLSVSGSVRTTAAFKTSSEGVNHTALCAPILTADQTKILALVYFQSQGLNMDAAYRLSDVDLISAIGKLISMMWVRYLTAAGLAKPGMTLREARQEVERRVIAARIKEFGANFAGAARSLGLSRDGLHDACERLGLMQAQEYRRFQRDVATEADAGAADPGVGDDA